MMATGQNELSCNTSGKGKTTNAEASITVLRTRLTLQPRTSSRVEIQPANKAPPPEPRNAIASGRASSSVVKSKVLR